MSLEVDIEARRGGFTLAVPLINFALLPIAHGLLKRSLLQIQSQSGLESLVGLITTQDRAELTLEVMGHQGLGWEGEAFTGEELTAVRSWLGGKATTIYGGSQEVQNNIISKRILGLPDLTQHN